jgi:regulatory protein
MTGASSGARSAALRLLGRRDYTTAELHTKLRDRDFPEDDITDVLGDLTAAGLVDDRRVGAAHVRTAASVKGRGRLRIARELAARGIDRALVRELLTDLPAEDEAREIARILARKRWPRRPSAADRRRMTQHLLRRGFPADAIAKALRAREDDD